MKILNISLCLTYMILCHHTIAQTKNTKQPLLGFRSAQVLKIGSLQFKDLNKNGKLDAYEDWRLPYNTRAKDLLSKMSVEEKVGFMLISTTRMKDDWSFEGPKSTSPKIGRAHV